MFIRLLSSSYLVLAAAMLLLGSSYVLAQTNKEMVSIKQNEEKIGTAIKNKVYYYPAFQVGSVQFLSGVKSDGILNYNMLSGEFEFINSRKDTLALDNMHTVSHIVVGDDTFYYDLINKKILKQLDEVNGRKLLVKEKYTLSNVKNVGAMGIESSTISPTVATNTDYVNNNNNALKPNAKLEFKIKSYYYFQHNDRYIPATKTNILKLYPNHSATLKSYIKEQNADFRTPAGILKVLNYAAQL
jgi:hypothetical protein